jgi:hypothetical protein
VLHVLRPQCVAAGVNRCGSDHGVIDGKAVPLGESQSCCVGLDCERMNRQQTAQHGQQRMGVNPGHLHRSARDIGEFIENLHANRPASGDGRLGPIRLLHIA